MSNHEDTPVTVPVLKKIYCIAGILVLLYGSTLVHKLVMHIWHAEGTAEASTMEMSEEERLFNEMIAGKEQQTIDLGYRVITQESLEGHFHHIGEEQMHDEINLCIRCHGDIPHDKNKVVRAFLNMHSDFFACETCHNRVDAKKFEWYDKINGVRKDEIQIDAYLSDSDFKLTPLKKTDEGFIRFDTEEREKFVEEFRVVLKDLGPEQKSKGLKLIHRDVAEKPVLCDECHAPTKAESYLPLESIGYLPERASQIVSHEVVGMVNKYKKFYLPSFLAPEMEE